MISADLLLIIITQQQIHLLTALEHYRRILPFIRPSCTNGFYSSGKSLKGALCSLGEDILIIREMYSLTEFVSLHKPNKQTLFDWINKINKLPHLKGQHNVMWFYLFICGGLCHLSSLRQCSDDIIFRWEQLLYSLMEVEYGVCIISPLIL